VDDATAKLFGDVAPNGNSIVAGMTDDEIKALARVVLASDNPAEMLAQVLGLHMQKAVRAIPEGTARQKLWDRVISYRMEAMLSGPKTQVVNVLNNALVALQRPAEYWLAGVRNSKTPAGAALREQGADMLLGLKEHYRESWAMARKAFAMGTNILDAGHGHKVNGSLGQWDGMGWTKWMHLPSRLLLSGDEFFKQLNYRAYVRSQILKRTREAGVPAEEFGKRIKDEMQFYFALGGDHVGQGVGKSALDYARVGTFTNDLEYGLGKHLQDWTSESNLGKVILPFVRTPVNITRYAWQRTPILNRFQRQMKDDLAAGGERAMIARGKMDMANMVWGSVALAVAGMDITGRGPSDPELRAQWREAGHRPYSIRIPGTDTWMEYRRLDPVFTSVGLIADMVQAKGEIGDEEFTEVSAGVIASIAASFSSKTFLQGITQFMDAMSSGRPDVVQALQESVVASFVPNVLRQTNPDDHVRETEGLVEELMARVPWASETLEARRNLLGEKIMLAPHVANRAFNPLTLAPGVKPNEVLDELVSLGKAFTMPSESWEEGMIDLRDRELFNDGPKKGQSPYDRMLEVMASPPGGMPSLRTRLEQLVQSDAYKNATGGPDGMKHRLASVVINSYKEMAKGVILTEYPSLRTAYGQANEVRAVRMARGDDGVQDVLSKYEKMFVKLNR
jgi:hypothetical protein